MQRQDYIERLIQEIARTIAAALGLAKAGDAQRAREELRAVWPSHVGLRREDLARLDPATVRMLLGEKREIAIRLLEAERDIGVEDATRWLDALR